MAVPANCCDYELERLRRIADNKRQLAEIGLLKQKTILDSFRVVKRVPIFKSTSYIRKEKPAKRVQPPRRSHRLQGEPAEISYAEIDDEDRPLYGDALVDLMDRKGYSRDVSVPAEPTQEQLEEVQQRRCASQGRGSVYDSAIGITCHFCRQKKLCGEEGCPRCQSRDASQECIGKTNCARCQSAFGRFCRACLLIRYGSELECVRQQMEEGTWLCPHCYEEENPNAGWMCNSSICMKRRGLRPTGIAIYEAQERGFKSVGHLLQSQILARGGVSAAVQAGGALDSQPAAAAEEPEAAAGPSGQQEQGAAEAGVSAAPVQGAVGRGRPPRAPAARLQQQQGAMGAEVAAGPGPRRGQAQKLPQQQELTQAAAEESTEGRMTRTRTRSVRLQTQG